MVWIIEWDLIMVCDEFVELRVFIIVVKDSSFIKVVVKLGVFLFVFSYIICGLEDRFGFWFFMCMIWSVLIIEVGDCLY